MAITKHANKWEMVRILLAAGGTEEEFVKKNKKAIQEILLALQVVPKRHKHRLHVASRALLLKYWNTDRDACLNYLAGNNVPLDRIFFSEDTHGGNISYTEMFKKATAAPCAQWK